MPIEEPKIKDRPDNDPKKQPDTGPDHPVREPSQKPKVKEPGKPGKTKR